MSLFNCYGCYGCSPSPGKKTVTSLVSCTTQATIYVYIKYGLGNAPLYVYAAANKLVHTHSAPTVWERNPVTCINDLHVTAQLMEVKPLQLLPRWTHDDTLDYKFT